MRLTLKEAREIIQRGDSGAYTERFISEVLGAKMRGSSAALSLDDALVAALVLSQLSDTTDGRKLLKKPKRKNTQYKAEGFGLFSPQMSVARDFLDNKIFQHEALIRLEATFDGGRLPDKDRTLKRLLEDLVDREESFRSAASAAMANCGYDGSPETREAAAQKFMAAFGYKIK